MASRRSEHTGEKESGAPLKVPLAFPPIETSPVPERLVMPTLAFQETIHRFLAFGESTHAHHFLIMGQPGAGKVIATRYLSPAPQFYPVVPAIPRLSEEPVLFLVSDSTRWMSANREEAEQTALAMRKITEEVRSFLEQFPDKLESMRVQSTLAMKQATEEMKFLLEQFPNKLEPMGNPPGLPDATRRLTDLIDAEFENAGSAEPEQDEEPSAEDFEAEVWLHSASDLFDKVSVGAAELRREIQTLRESLGASRTAGN